MSLRSNRTDSLVRTLLATGSFQSLRFDANETTVFARELEQILVKNYDIKYPENKGRLIIPKAEGISNAVETVTYRQYDIVGEAKMVDDHAKDFPRVEIKGAQFSTSIKSIGDSYGYTVDELRRAQLAWKQGLPGLDAKLAFAARRVIENKLDQILCTGDTNTNLKGLANAPNVPVYVLPTLGAWSTLTPDQIRGNLNAVLDDIFVQTKEVFGGENTMRLVVPTAALTAMRSAKLSVYSDVSVYQYILDNAHCLKDIVSWSRLNTAGAGSTTRAVVFPVDGDVAEAIIPQEFEQMPPEVEGMAFKIACRLKTGGVQVRYPLAMRYIDGI